MKLFVACPSHSGSVTCAFMSSWIDTMMGLMADGIDHVIKFHVGESAIGRGRNHLALDFLESGCDKLLFLDTDLLWKYRDIQRLIRSDKAIIGGTYPLKAFPITLNFNPLREQRGELFATSDYLTEYKKWVQKYANEKGEIEVLHVPTGMLLIDKSVFAALAPLVPHYYSHDPRTRETKEFRDFFPMRVRDHEYETEDWAFCSMAREVGFKIYLQCESIAAHTGFIHYGLGSHVVQGQPPIIRP